MIFLLFIAIIVCVLLALIVLIQNPKGGGLSSNFSSSSQLLGVQKTGDILEKGTWILAISLMVLCLAISLLGKGNIGKTESGANQELINHVSKPAGNSAPASFPALPAQGKKQ